MMDDEFPATTMIDTSLPGTALTLASAVRRGEERRGEERRREEERKQKIKVTSVYPRGPSATAALTPASAVRREDV